MLAMKPCSLFGVFFAFSLPLSGQSDPIQAAPSPRLTIQDSACIRTGRRKARSPNGWFANPPATVNVDNQVVHLGSGRFASIGPLRVMAVFSVITRSIPVDFAGGKIELRGHFRTKDVAGYAGLWMREDGEGQMLKLENMAASTSTAPASGAEYTIKLPIDAKARQLFFGVLLAGTGTRGSTIFACLSMTNR